MRTKEVGPAFSARCLSHSLDSGRRYEGKHAFLSALDTIGKNVVVSATHTSRGTLCFVTIRHKKSSPQLVFSPSTIQKLRLPFASWSQTEPIGPVTRCLSPDTRSMAETGCFLLRAAAQSHQRLLSRGIESSARREEMTFR